MSGVSLERSFVIVSPAVENNLSVELFSLNCLMRSSRCVNSASSAFIHFMLLPFTNFILGSPSIANNGNPFARCLMPRVLFALYFRFVNYWKLQKMLPHSRNTFVVFNGTPQPTTTTIQQVASLNVKSDGTEQHY